MFFINIIDLNVFLIIYAFTSSSNTGTWYNIGSERLIIEPIHSLHIVIHISYVDRNVGIYFRIYIMLNTKLSISEI